MTLAQVVIYDVYASRPAFGIPGRLFLVSTGTNAGNGYYDTGSAWELVIAPGGGSPLTTKGDLFGFSSANARVPIGSNGQVLTADSTQTLGLKWAAGGGGGGGGGLVLLETETASSSSALNFASRNASGQSGATFQSDYDEYQIEIVGLVTSTTATIGVQMSTDGGSSYDTGSNYGWQHGYLDGTSAGNQSTSPDTQMLLFFVSNAATANLGWMASLKLAMPLSTALYKQMWGDVISTGGVNTGVHSNYAWAAIWRSLSVANAFRLIPSAGNFASGSVRVYGLAQ